MSWPAADPPPSLVSPIVATPTPPPPWQVIGLPSQAMPLTRFELVDVDGQRALRVEAHRSYGNLVHPLRGAAAGQLRWRWRVDHAPVGADLRRKAGDDAALKVCVMFDLPESQVPFYERQLLRWARARTGEPLPTATLCYVWDALLPHGSVLHNAYTSRVRMIVLHGAFGRWSEEQRDLNTDFLRAFGDESSTTPSLLAVAIGADADNTGSRSLAYIADLRYTPR